MKVAIRKPKRVLGEIEQWWRDGYTLILRNGMRVRHKVATW